MSGTIVGTAAVILFAVALCLYHSLNKRFLAVHRLMQENIRKIGQYGGPRRIEKTGNVGFDHWVEPFNAMLSRLEENGLSDFYSHHKAQNAEIAKQRAIVASLKRQINAHFTVNTLNVIKRLSAIGNTEAVNEMCDGFSSLLQYANGADDFIGGMEEMQVMEKYLSMMSIRHPGQFVVDISIDDQLDDVVLPRMLIQPIVENAVLHGVCELPYAGRITLSAWIEQNQVLIEVRDNGRGIATKQLEALRHKLTDSSSQDSEEQTLSHLGLSFVQQYVTALFGPPYGLLLDATEGEGTTVTLRLPIQSASECAASR